MSGTYHYRNALVGPDEWSVKATFEIGPKSLNRFLRGNDDVCGALTVVEKPDADRGAVTAAEKTAAQKCVTRLVSFAGVDDPSRQPDAGDRLSFAIEYRQAKGRASTCRTS